MEDDFCPVLLLDGGLGTTLEAPPYNVRFSSATPLWSSHLLLDSPDILLAAQQDFVRAGVDVLLTATYQTSYEGFETTLVQAAQQASTLDKNLSSEKCTEIAEVCMTKAVSIARKAFSTEELGIEYSHKGRSKFVALSLGAYGACMTPSQEYTGKYSPEIYRTFKGLETWHNRRLSVFTDNQQTWNEIGIVAFETIPLREEIHAARSVMAIAVNDGNSKPWYISCVFPNSDMRLPDGTGACEVLEAMLGNDVEEALAQPWGIGINCTRVSRLEALVREFEAALKKMEMEGKLRPRRKDGHFGTLKDGHPHAVGPWLVLCPDGTKNEEYNTSTQAWEIKVDGNTEDTRPWDEEIFDIVKETRLRGLWAGIMVGGCCRTSADDIGRLRNRIDML